MPLSKCSNKIRRIVRIRQMLRRWRARAASSIRQAAPPPDVPSGHVAVVVGSSLRRYVVRASHLNHPVFAGLLFRAEEEYGFSNPGPLAIPCDESLFEEALRLAARSDPGRRSISEELRRCSHVDSARYPPEFVAESRPLLNGI